MRAPLLGCFLLACLACAVASCSSTDAPGDAEGSDEAENNLIGGQPATAKAFDAVGVLLEVGRPYCTATLIAPQAVITASHCVTNQRPTHFGIGAKFGQLEQIAVSGYDMIRLGGSDGFGNMGVDVAIVRLATAVDVKPMPIATSAPTKDDTLITLGFGYDQHREIGNRRKGTIGFVDTTSTGGRPLPALFDTFDKFAAAYCTFLGQPATFADDPELQSDLKAAYAAKLLDGYEMYGLAKHVQNCSGDSGGPLLRVVGSRTELVGIASTVGMKSPDQESCAFGTAFVMPMAPKVKAFVATMKGCDWVGPSGACDDRTALSCEGSHSQKTRCAGKDVCLLVDDKAKCAAPR